MVDWNDNKKRKEFREALQEVYPSVDALAIFVDEELNENLVSIAGGDNLQAIAYNLVKWANAQGRIQAQGLRSGLYDAFKEGNPRHPVIAKLERSSFLSQTYKPTEGDWDVLFEQFLPNDLADLQRAFRQGFKQAVGIEFQQAQPNLPPFVELTQIREQLGLYATGDQGPVLAVRFVECAIAEIQRTQQSTSEGNDRNLTALEQWRDRITQQHHVPPLTPEPPQAMGRQGYLLVAFEESGSDVIVYPELRVTGEPSPIEFGVSPVTCPFGQVPGYLSDWIYRAEKALEGKHDGEILLELFLPCALLEEDLATTWKVKDKRNRPISLGMHRLFVVRSFDRIRDDDAQKLLERKWELLQKCVRDGNACDKFHLQEKYLETKGALLVLLKDVPGLKLVAKFPPAPEKRQDLLYEMIDAAVPIALWSPSVNDAMLTELKTQMNNLAQESHLINFADLARRWQEKLAQSETESVKHIRLLCDCPDRLPNLPDPDREEDLLVA